MEMFTSRCVIFRFLLFQRLIWCADSWFLPVAWNNGMRGPYFFKPCQPTATQRLTKMMSKQDEDARSREEEGPTTDECDEHENASPYKRRSLAWTNRYRKLIPYEDARARAMSIGLRSKAEWDDYQESGEARQHGPYLPSRPDLMYPDDWVSWDEFLGIMRPYDEARDLIRTLGIQNFDEYELFIHNDKKRAEGLRIPAKPHIVYRDKGWTSFEDFFGCFD